MTKVLTLISNPENPTLNDEIKDQIAAAVNASSTKWLNKNIAFDIYFDGEIDTSIIKGDFDYAVQDVATRGKKLLLADMDSTIIQCECIDELADFLGIKDKVSGITEAAMRGEIDFKGALRERVALLKGLNVSDLETVFNQRVKLTPGAETLVKTMNANGANTVLVSGGFTYFTGRVSEITGFKANRANILLHEDGKLTGEVGEPIVDSDTKINTLREFQSADSLETHEIIAVGDGANDIPMLNGAGLGVGYHPFPAAGEAADVAIEHADLTALLYLQGYSIDDFVD
ncbi:phosphoserine phosphatase SerB [Pseudemcibacter aquimaris]|uniref:phosphoserine phosphatase SerB n=1 Tax=Pseudemcibacter aquimaris TaxID=2857064 RepID=UPI002010CABF|nr:phosphoserine phosphatase SerB [Pseudemcibacter aquimaris]MCC3860260.1 phosphoserine phosphatase SerB [Pseudemcibacter aquimaris]WDU57585.1 phosphoserine phosphatase SerB [Pseudemcibacter aquimaris]